MYCKKCGAEIPDNSVYCPVCGEKAENDEESNEDDFSSIHIVDSKDEELEAITILAFIFAFILPVVGLILGIVSHNKDYGSRNNQFDIASIVISIIIIFLAILIYC